MKYFGFFKRFRLKYFQAGKLQHFPTKELLENKVIKAEAAQIWQIKTTNKAKVQGFGCKVRK